MCFGKKKNKRCQSPAYDKKSVHPVRGFSSVLIHEPRASESGKNLLSKTDSSKTTPGGLPVPEKGISAGIDVPNSTYEACPVGKVKPVSHPPSKAKPVSRPPSKAKAVARFPSPQAKKKEQTKPVPPSRPPSKGRKIDKGKPVSPSRLSSRGKKIDKAKPASQFPLPFKKKDQFRHVPSSRFAVIEKKCDVKTKIIPPSLLSKQPSQKPSMGLPVPERGISAGIAVPTSIWGTNNAYKPKGRDLDDDDMYNPKQYAPQQQMGRPTGRGELADDDMYNPKQYTTHQKQPGRAKELTDDDLYNPMQYN